MWRTGSLMRWPSRHHSENLAFFRSNFWPWHNIIPESPPGLHKEHSLACPGLGFIYGMTEQTFLTLKAPGWKSNTLTQTSTPSTGAAPIIRATCVSQYSLTMSRDSSRPIHTAFWHPLPGILTGVFPRVNRLYFLLCWEYGFRTH